MKKKKKPSMPEVLMTVGGAALSCGVGMIHIAAGVITAGVLLIVAGILASLGGDGQ